jgi:hypothetical protein
MSSVNQTVSSSTSTGKGNAIALPATHHPQEEEDIFVLASQLEAILQGKSYKTCLKALNMVGSLHAIRCIPADRPIGQSTVGTTKVVQQAIKPKKGQPTPPAAWKQTDDYRRLNAEREEIVTTIKSSTDEENILNVGKLRAVEQQLKALKSPSSGDH